MSPISIAKLTSKREEMNAKQPPFDAVMRMTLEAWNTLDSCRGIGMDVGPIPWTAIIQWCERHPYLDDELTNMIADAINHLDSERRKSRAAKRDTSKPKGKGR